MEKNKNLKLNIRSFKKLINNSEIELMTDYKGIEFFVYEKSKKIPVQLLTNTFQIKKIKIKQ